MVLLSVICMATVILVWHSQSLAAVNICPSENSITTEAQEDGFGAQYQAMIQVFAMSLHRNETYCHLRWTRMAHHMNASSMFDFVGGTYYGPEATEYTLRRERSNANHFFRRERTFYIYLKARDIVRGYYNTARKREKTEWYADNADECFGNTTKHVALHMRRGDVNQEEWPDKWLPQSTELKCAEMVMKEINAAHSTGCTQLHIMSEGKEADFAAFKHFNPQYHLSQDALKTFHHMVKADVLILSPSTFSNTAGYINDGKLYSTRPIAGFSSACL